MYRRPTLYQSFLTALVRRSGVSVSENDNLAEPQVKPLKTQAADGPTMWTDGPHLQFGISAVLCEGGSHAKTKELNQAGGVVLVKSIAEFYNTAK